MFGSGKWNVELMGIPKILVNTSLLVSNPGVM